MAELIADVGLAHREACLAQGSTVLTLPSSQTPPDRLGRYPVTGHLGSGGCGEILRVLDPEVGREMAAKVIRGRSDSRVLTRFLREGQITGQLEHPNIVPLYELGTTPDGRIYFTMKRVDGRDLAEQLATERKAEGAREVGGAGGRPSGRWRPEDSAMVRKKTLSQLLQIFLKVCDAMSFAHSKGVIHRDLKPANIMIGRFGEVHVMDWGLAAVVGQLDLAVASCTLDLTSSRLSERVKRGESGEPLKTQDGAVFGTPHYMPPEQARGEIDRLDQRADVYSLGAILYQMLTLELPFDGGSVWDVLQQVIDGELESPSDRTPGRAIPWELEVVVLRAMSVEREERYATVAEMQRDIEAYLDGRLLQAAHYSTWQVLKKWAGRNRPAGAAATGVLLAVVLAFIGIIDQWQRAEAHRSNAEKAQQAEAVEKRKVLAEQHAKDAVRNRLGDVQLELELRDRIIDLGPQGWKQARLRSWLGQAEAVFGRLAAHRARQELLRRRGPRKKTVDTWELKVLDRLIPRVEQLGSPISMVAGWLRDRPWDRWRELNRTTHQARWAAAIAAIKTHPAYGKLELRAQEGLLPLGPDPKSGLWEFAHLPSGQPPQRRADGTWEITGETSVVLVLLPGGEFQMGYITPGLGVFFAGPDEKPVHRVQLAPFWISKYELTQGQWRRLTRGPNPSQYQVRDQFKLAHPVERVSWEDCRRWLARSGLVLPTEAQWEYATRAGTLARWWSGNDLALFPKVGNVADLALRKFTGRLDCELWTDTYPVHAPVGRLRPNGFGLHDVIGNVAEWVRDPYWRDAYRISPSMPDDWRNYPEEAFKGARVMRGGSWASWAINSRSGCRVHGTLTLRSGRVGCRPVRRIPR